MLPPCPSTISAACCRIAHSRWATFQPVTSLAAPSNGFASEDVSMDTMSRTGSKQSVTSDPWRVPPSQDVTPQ